MASPLYTMRALANPGPGYVTWQYGYPDYAGTYAPAAILAGTVVIVSGPVPLESLGKLDTTYSPAGLWLFENNLNDSSGNGLNLTGTVSYTSVKDGHVCARLGGSLSMATSSPTLAITGALTVECVVLANTSPMFALFSYGSSGDTEPANICYMVRILSSPSRGISILWEYGAGTDVGLSAGINTMPFGWFTHLAVTRSATNPATTSIYVNGIAVATGSATACTGGNSTSSRFRIGADDLNSLTATASIFSSFKIIAAELTPAQVVAEYNRVLGGRGIVYPRL